MAITIRVGLSSATGRMPCEMERRGLPVLLSANSCFDHRAKRFRALPMNVQDLDVALDSAGFVAMKLYKRYPWSIAQYIEFAVVNGFSWYSQMDCCCEPEIAPDRETVTARVFATSQMLQLCRDSYSSFLDRYPEFAMAATSPMPIVQGWQPEDYVQSVEFADRVLGGQWPEMIGVGSVCRRHLNGPDGLWRVLTALDRVLPIHVHLHLFGVKGAALRGFADHPRVVSVDSMAFEMGARVDARERKVSKTIEVRAQALDRWLDRQASAARPCGMNQLSLAM